MAASEVAQKERDVPTLRRTAGAGLEVAGALGLELEEDEEEAAARRARSFAQDARVRFLGGRLEQVLGLPAEKWSRHLESEDNRQVLGAFLESPSPACLVFSVAAAGWLAASWKLQAPIVLKMVKILKSKQSSYFPTLKDVFVAVKNALLEAQDVELHLRPLRRHIQCLQEMEFPHTRVLIAPLFHTICLIWSHSKFYNTPARIIVLLQEFCNLFIDQATAYLSPDDLLKGEIEDSLEKVQVAINILETFKNSFFNYRKGLAKYFMGDKELKPWDFQSHLVFCRFDKFLDRFMKIEDIFVTVLEFEKLERLEFGGTKGAILNGQIHKMNEEFMELCKIFKHSTYNPSDYNNMLLTVFGNFLEKPVVMEIFSPHYSTLVYMFNAELDACKQLYNEHVKQIERGNVVLNKNMPFTSGNIKWAKEVLERLQKFWSNFASLQYLLLESPDDASVYQKYVEMTTLLDQFENRIFNEWKSNVNEICEFNLNQPLIKFSAINGLLSVNFDPKLVAVLREVKYLIMLKKSGIPDSALAIFKKRDTILKYIGNLELLVQGYNKLKQTLLGVEYPLIEDELRAVDEQLQAAATSLTWQGDCWGYIERVKTATLELERRVERTQDNVRVIQQTMRAWAECTLLARREHRREAAFILEDKGDLFIKKYKLIHEDGCKIHSLVEENRKLFKADPSLDTWKIYVEFIDDIVVEGFFQAIMHDLDFFLMNTEKQLKPAPFFQAQMILMPPEILFKPSLEREAGDGFYDLVEEMLCNSFRMSAQMKRVAVHLEIANYQNDMDNMLGLAEVRQEIMNRVAGVITKVLDFRNTLDTYAYLWVDDRAEFMKHFLLYGQTVSSEEMDAQIDVYEALYVQMTKFDDFRVFDSWFKVDMKPFKVSLLNIIRKWSWMFQEHLLRFVIDSLNELQEFIKETDAGLQRELSEGSHDGLVDIMGHLLAIRSRQRATDELFEPLRETITLLETYGQKMPEQVYIQLEGKQAEFRERFRLYAPFGFNAGNPYTVLDTANQELEALEEEMLQMQESSRLFEVALPEYKQMKQCRKEIKLLKGLWDVIIYVREIWSLDKEVRVWDAYAGLEGTVKDMTTFLRAVTELRSPALRDRHWHQLTKATGVNFSINEATTLADLLALQLHQVEDDVRSIVDKAVKELGTEKVITEISQTWATMEFSYEVHCRTGIPLLKSDEQLFETLEHNQVQLQTLLQSKYVEYFMEQVLSWQNQLNVADSVIFTWMEVQRTWSHLESIFVCSEDIRIQLVKDARRFDKVNAEFKVTRHLAKLFDSIADLQFEDDQDVSAHRAIGMSSKEKEYVPFQAECDCIGHVETWLVQLEQTMQETVRHSITEAIVAYDEKPRELWIFDFPAQVALTSSQIWWTTDVGIAFSRLEEGYETALKDFHKKQVVSPQAFAWLSQLRHRWEDTQKHCFVNICDAQFQYFYEYLGNSPRLVITPLTDRCYITLTQSLHLTMSGAPAGPAGTGKTETTKDLGRALGMMVYVFNCSEQMDYKSIGNIYKGLVQTGAWGCFDEFNRISVEVLSVVAVQVKMIHDAIRNRKKRPCAMVAPDIELICEIMLVAEGFVDARSLARKFITLHALCRELLSKQDHYDWGLRAIKSVLVVAGSLKREDKNRPEDQVLMRALRDFNMPKIVTDDIPVFLGLVGDLFPALDVPRRRAPHFEQMVRQSTLELRLQPEESFILKFIGLFSSILREQANLMHDGPKWMVLDGDIDPMWIESLNTVMDDNKVLTLASNERVALTPSMRLLFEIHHLRTATPATVSRAGILYVASWIDRRQHQSEKANLTILFDKYVPACLDKLRTSFKTITSIPENSLVQTICALLECLLTPENVPSDSPKEVYEVYFVFACIWAFGGTLLQDQISAYQAEFSRWWHKEMKAVKFPSQGTIFDYYLDHKTKKFLPWADKIPKFTMDPDIPLQRVLVHTSETTRLRYFVKLLLEKGQPLMLVGNAGVGKTVFVGDTLASLPEDYVVSRVPFNYYTTSAALQRILEKPLEKKAGRNYGPGGNKKLVYFIDDMNIPEVDLYGTVQPHTLIRQHIDYGHWYDRQKVMLKEIRNCQYVTCMNPMVGSFSINPRLQRHFTVFAFNFPSLDALNTIYSQILSFHFQQQAFSPSVLRNGPTLIQATIAFHQMMTQSFLPTAIKFHYLFNLRDLSNIFQGVDSHVLLQQPLIFCHFANGGEDPCYMPVKDWKVLKTILTETLDNYNELNAAMHLVLFEDAMQHVCRISRVLQAPQGYALLIGVGGSGKQSLSRLAAYICGLEVFQITLTEGFGIQELQNWSQEHAHCNAQVLDESFLVLINDLLASGEILDLFSDEDVDKIISGIRNEVRALGMVDSRENCWQFFLARVRLQLKSVCRDCCWCTVTITNSRRNNCPAFALLATANRQPSKEGHSFPCCTDERMEAINTAQQNLLKKKQKEVSQKKEHLVNGIQKLKTTASQVGDLKARLASQEAELQLRNHDAEALITKIGLQTEKVSQEKAVADAEERKVTDIQTEVSQKQKECEADLLKAEPALVAATAALNTLNRVNLTELKAFPNPPNAVTNVTAAVMVLLAPRGRVPKDRSWKAAKVFMGKVNLTELKAFPNPPNAVTNVTAAVMVLLAPRGRVPKDRSWKAAKVFMGKVDDFLQALINYDKEHIPENCLKVVNEQYLKDPEFNPNLIQTKSFAAAGLCAWVINIIKFYEVYCDVEPKRQALAQANLELAAATEKLEGIRKKLEDLDRNLSRLTASFEKAIAKKVQCQEESEKVRWGQSIKSFETQEKTLCGDVLLTAAFVSYVGSFTQQYRQELVDCKWVPFLQQKVSIPITEGLDLIAMLTDDATIAAWNNEGLPSDRMSTENATILTHCARWPLMIDPQQQGIKWIKTKYGTNLKVTHLGQKGFLNVIETALAFGDVILIENVEETIDPVLDPLLGRNTIKKGKYIKIGDKECEFNKNFRLILHTKLANPHYQPELQAQTTLLNFSVTEDGLESQLLAEVVSVERPDLEKLKLVLTKHQNDFKIELKYLEDDLLLRLSAAEGSFLDDTKLVERLETTKATAAEIEHKVIEAKENEKKINEARECYRPVAARASLLYFVINDLRKINPIYQFSLKAFNMLFHRAIKQADKVEDMQGRLSILIESITHAIFLYTSQALFEKDKLTFLSQMAFQILLRKKEIDPVELDFLLRFTVEHTYLSPVDFLTTQSWSAIKAVALMDEFRGLDRDVEGSAKQWRKWVESECPEKEKLPQEWKKKNLIQKLILLRAMRPDRVTYALRNFVEEKLGAKYVERTRLDLVKAFEESSPATPVFFILSPGVDALKDLEILGKRLGFTIDSGKFHNVSLGQGQETVAEMALENASKGGHWVLLQNVHLVAKWLGTLEKLLERFSQGSHRDYRVFMSAETAPTPSEHIIPQGLLENSIKITNEPPTGMLANLHAALYNFDQDTLEVCSKEQEFKSILFALCYFHACVAGRLRFGPQGWSRSYPFSPGDLTICANVLCNYLEANPNVPWEDLRYLFGEIMYGGHITDDWDRKLCRVYLEEFMKPSLIEDELMLAPGFAAPPNLDYSGYHQYIEEMLPPESPALYGLHPNAEIEFLTVTSNTLFRTLLEMQPRNSLISEELGQSTEDKVKNVLDDILEKLPEEFNMAEIMQKNSNRSPYVLVCFQECERMNILLREIRVSLQQLDLGLKGELMFSPEAEAQQTALSCDAVPDTWSKLAYPSTYGLAQWFNDLLLRCRELDTWTQDLALPAVVWLSGFFNPQSFLTAIMQTMARKNEWPLDKMCLTVDVTKKTKEDYGHPPREGAYLSGLLMEGARWDIQSGTIVEARLKELTSVMPVIFAKAITMDREETKHTYACPVYKTKTRGPNYVWTFRLKSKEKTAKWVLAGVALLLEA
ncbi:Dynein heavy chain 11, axonemal [Pteropus alecto]|uniref:Dynein axonemal heavy chain 11 n=1 Tax=Pteropus alecto TaxID=9402 RepID=L5KM09_PTEAL|nr:Dynein heavy chain 11, axonemal [Pteropus alecto]